jgi:hypothetical protein
MNAIKFTSVLNPDKYGYVYERSATEHWDICYRTAGILSYHSFFFETYGDGRCQHTPLSPVASMELALDWMISLAAHLSAHPEEYVCELRTLFGYGMPAHDTASFLAEIKAPKETDPTVYYSVNEHKVSRSESKRHDKRWFTLPSSAFQHYYDIDRFVQLWQDGQEPRSMALIERLGVYFSLADGLNRSVSYQQSDLLQKMTNEEVLDSARVLREIIRALDAEVSAKRSIEIVVGNHLRAKQTATQAAA